MAKALPDGDDLDEVTRLRVELAAARAEAARARSEHDLAISTAQAGTYDWDPRGQAVTVSRMFGRLTGLTREDPGTFEAWMERIHPDDRSRVRGEIQAALDQDRPYDTTYRCVWRDGSLHWHTSRAKITRDADGRPVRVLGVVIDVSDRHRLEAIVARSERLAKLGELAAGIAHEINNPLAYVLASLELALTEMPPGHPASAALADALDGTGRVREIVQSLRLLARPQVDDCSPTEMGAVVAAVERVARAEITRSARLTVDVPRDLPAAMGNATQLGQVLMNLVLNAAQAMPERRPIADNHIVVAARASDGAITLTVRDNGAGIPDDIKPRIFDPFFTTKPTGVGTGLGLALSHRFVTAMHGTLTVESAVGVGTTFTVTVPRAAPPAPAPTAERASILLVDDDAQLRRTISRLLAPHDVTVADGGPAALALLEHSERFDAILCDVSMPDMTGPELIDQLRERHPRLARRVVYMTGNSLQLDGRVPAEAPRLEKPFTRQALAATIATVLAR